MLAPRYEQHPEEEDDLKFDNKDQLTGWNDDTQSTVTASTNVTKTTVKNTGKDTK